MQDYSTQKAFTKANMGTLWPAWVLIGTCHESVSMSKCVHHIERQQLHRGTFGISPHNYPMPQIASTDQLLMESQEMTDALKHHYLDVPFATVGDATITAITTLASIFTT